MKRSGLKKRAKISNNPEITKLFKKERNDLVDLTRKRQNFSEDIYRTVRLLKTFGNFGNHSFQMKQQILMTKLY